MEERTCRGCGVPGDFGTYARDDRIFRQPRCPDCRREQRREADRRFRLGHGAVEQAPDRQVAERLRDELADLRRDGFPFDRAWKVAVIRVTCDLERHDAADWRVAFRATRPAWSRAYHRISVSEMRLFTPAA